VLLVGRRQECDLLEPRLVATVQEGQGRLQPQPTSTEVVFTVGINGYTGSLFIGIDSSGGINCASQSIPPYENFYDVHFKRDRGTCTRRKAYFCY
jgi:hypothetical protein